MISSLEQLRKWVSIAIDTASFEEIEAFKPQDATTNPSLILKAAQDEQYHAFCRAATQDARHEKEAVLQLLVHFGREILRLIPGRVSIEVDARLSFDVQGMIHYARQLVEKFREHGVDPERVLIKIAATWEGIQAAQMLEREGIHVNLTLVFSLEQAIAGAQAGVRLISPFVGRILDWYRQNAILYDQHPGIVLVERIVEGYRSCAYGTQIMAASLRELEEVLALTACDFLTMSPRLLVKLQNSDAEPKHPSAFPKSKKFKEERSEGPKEMEEIFFRAALKENAMADEKLREGIQIFCRDTEALEELFFKIWR